MQMERQSEHGEALKRDFTHLGDDSNMAFRNVAPSERPTDRVEFNKEK